ncbi:CarD family transcriptional regulator [Herbiconiux sp. 11R-BC]|uniref:CarD family transcriptional regulator n=1 Tax=Herbiconiux sp. 11R-BC TaxID=3111637 RepID=UPI003C03CA29
MATQTGLTLEVGQTVIYPRHGAVTVTAVTTRTVHDAAVQYVTLEVLNSRLTIQVPVAGLSGLGVRPIIDENQIGGLLAVLRAVAGSGATEASWTRRFKANTAKIGSRELSSVAEVFRDLVRRDSERGISLGEKEMLSQATKLLASEFALARGGTDDEAVELLRAEALQPA